MATLTKQDQRMYERALSTNDADYIGRTLAIIARSGSSRTYKAVCELIDRYHDFQDFINKNGTIIHKTEA